jgi:glycosyltransferase involved in cell wall biosynthesis
MRVAMLIRAYAPRVGGAERQLGAIAPRLKAAGVDVHVITRRDHQLPAFSVVDDIPVHRVPVPGPPAVASLAYTAGALALLRRLRPDVVHAHEFFSPGTTASAAKRLLHLPIVATAHRSGPLGDIATLRASRGGEQRLAALRTNVDRFVVISDDISDELAAVGIPRQRQVQIVNGVDERRFHPPEPGEKARLRAELGLPLAGPLALFTGRLADEKRVAHLLDVWPAVRSRHPEASCAVLGTGELEPQLRSRNVAGVHFYGLVDDVSPYHRASDLFVLPSIAEGLSVAMLEALASGVPALMSNVGGTGQVIEHGHNGWLTEPDDVPALRDALIALLGDPALSQRMGQQGRRTVEARYTLDVAVGRHVELYRQVATTPNG